MANVVSIGVIKPKLVRFWMVAAVLLAGGVFPSAVRAQNVTWTGNTNSTWSTGTNWLGGSPPANDLVTNIAQFSSNLTLTSPNVGTAIVAGINVTSNFTYNGTGSFTFNGTSLNLGGNGITVNAGFPTFNANLVAAVSQTWTGNSSYITINGNITINANQTLTLAQTSTGNGFYVYGTISDGGGSGNLTINNAGSSTSAIRLNATNSTYTGKTVIPQGVLYAQFIADAGTASSLGAPTGANSIIDINSGATLGVFSGNTNRTLNLYGGSGNSTLYANGDNFTGLITVADGAPHTLVLGGSAFALNTLSGVIPDAATNPATNYTSLIKNSGAAPWELTGLNTYTGPTIIQNGLLIVPKLADAGVASSLGAAAGANAAIQICGAFASGSRLSYIGSGDGSNRPFQLVANTANNFTTIESAGTGPLNLSGNITSNATGNQVMQFYLSASTLQTNVFSGAISGNVTSVTKDGPGTWVFSGANSYTGNTVVNSGTLVLDLSAHPDGVIAQASNLFLGGFYNSTLLVKGNNTVLSGQTLSNPGFRDGAQTISINPNGGPGTTLTLSGNWTGGSGCALNLVLPTNAFLSTNTSLLTSNLIADPTSKMAYVTVNGNNFATVSSGNNVVEYTGYVTLNATSNNATLNCQVTGNLTHNGGAWGMNVLKIAPLSAGTLDLGGGTASLAGQAILFTGNQNYAINNGTLGAANSNLLFQQYGTGVLTVNSTLGGGTIKLTKAGPGTLVIASTNNSYTGVTGIYGGVLSVTKLANGGVNSSIGAANGYSYLVLDGGTLQYVGTGDSTNRGFTIGLNGGTLEASGTGNLNFTYSGAGSTIYTETPGVTTLTLTGTNTGNNTLANLLADSTNGALNGSLNLVKAGGGDWTLTNNSNTYSGPTNINGGVLVQGAPNAISSNSNIVFNGGALGLAAGNFTRSLGTGAGQVQFAGSGGFAAFGGNYTVNIGGNLTPQTLFWGSGNFVPSGSNLILGGASATGTINFQNPINMTGNNGTIQVNPGAAAVAAVISGNISGTGSVLTKTGSGNLALTGCNTYSGGTNINAGLVVAGGNQALGSGNATVNNGGALAVAPGVSMANSITVNNGGSYGPQTLVNASGSYSAFSSTIPNFVLGQINTKLTLLAGTASANTTLTALWRARNSAEGDVNTPGSHPPLPPLVTNLISDVVNFSGTNGDLYALQLSYNPLQISGNKTDTQLLAAGLLYLAYKDITGSYVNAGNTTLYSTPITGRGFNPGTDFNLGKWGVDTANDVVWAVVNHNSEWAVVPEPGTLVLLALGSLAVMKVRRKKR